MAKLLVTGGAGYVGSHCAKALVEAGHECLVYDNLSRGHRESVKWGTLIEGDLRDADRIARVLASHAFDGVLHFAALAYVGESVHEPARYYLNNVVGTLNLLEAMRAAAVDSLVFSSTCSVYGNPVSWPMTEDHPKRPVNPYGMTKLISERAMEDYGRAYGLRTVALRYFNAAGCDPGGELGERHDPETHLIPLVLLEALRLKAGGKPADTKLQVFGDDFDTPDGTCIRDYVHVTDLGAAHRSAIDHVKGGGAAAFEAFNLGSGIGYSVMEVIDTCRRVTGQEIGFRVVERRTGDPARLVANASSARAKLGWSPAYTELPEIVETAWRWMSRGTGC